MIGKRSRMARNKKAKRIALLSDVHGNLPALEAVLADAAENEAEQVWNLGDFLGYAPFPNEVIDLLRADDTVNIVGNYDLKVLEFPEKQQNWKRRKTPAKYAAFEWNHERLTKRGRRFLASLPEQRRLTVNGFEVLLVHGSPVSVDELLNSDTPEARFAELAESARADVVLCGHSHEPFVKDVHGTRFVNPGSAGRPEGGDWRASYAMLEWGEHEVRVTLRRVAYDVERVSRAVHAAGLPEEFTDVFREARSLDQLREQRAADCPARPAAAETDRLVSAALTLARRCNYEREHTHQVTRLTLELFDELKDLHGMGPRERLWLRCGALLHDIGWVEGAARHHKTALELIVADSRLPLERRERHIVALIACYHRKALPAEGHKYFRDLDPTDQHRVRVLAGILRVADGLDRSHTNVVRGVKCATSNTKLTILCDTSGPAGAETAAATKKANLLEEVLARTVVVLVDAESRRRARAGHGSQG
jgi:putative phosphoesterase